MSDKWMNLLYWDDLILRFRRLKYQLNRLKTQKWIDKYSKIEEYKIKYITFRRFYNECQEYFERRYMNEETSETVQEIFDNLI